MLTLKNFFVVYLVIISTIPRLDEVLNSNYQNQLLLFSRDIQDVLKIEFARTSEHLCTRNVLI